MTVIGPRAHRIGYLRPYERTGGIITKRRLLTRISIRDSTNIPHRVPRISQCTVRTGKPSAVTVGIIRIRQLIRTTTGSGRLGLAPRACYRGDTSEPIQLVPRHPRQASVTVISRNTGGIVSHRHRPGTVITIYPQLFGTIHRIRTCRTRAVVAPRMYLLGCINYTQYTTSSIVLIQGYSAGRIHRLHHVPEHIVLIGGDTPSRIRHLRDIASLIVGIPGNTAKTIGDFGNLPGGIVTKLAGTPGGISNAAHTSTRIIRVEHIPARTANNRDNPRVCVIRNLLAHTGQIPLGQAPVGIIGIPSCNGLGGFSALSNRIQTPTAVIRVCGNTPRRRNLTHKLGGEVVFVPGQTTFSIQDFHRITGRIVNHQLGS